jgi:hypothetical protein
MRTSRDASYADNKSGTGRVGGQEIICQEVRGLALAPALAHSGEMKPQFNHENTDRLNSSVDDEPDMVFVS